MALLAEYALTPDVFDVTAYTGEEVCGLHLQALKEVLLQEGLVRDLRNGEWGKLFVDAGRPWHRRGKELLKKLISQKRLVPANAARPDSPDTDCAWCEEALASHQLLALAGIVVSDLTATPYAGNPLVSSVTRLGNAAWWQARSLSLRLPRTIVDYVGALDLFLRYANSLMFIDPHLDPSRYSYSTFSQIIQAIGSRRPTPRIEVHRVCYRGSGPNRVILTPADVEAAFRPSLSPALSAHGLTAEVFVWDDFHYRCLITNLAGVLLDNGFDVSGAATASTLWSRLGRDVRDDVQREFDPASHRHSLLHRFVLP
jgi:hypothetical protein